MTDEFDAVVAAARERFNPDDAERERLERVVTEVRGRAERAVADLPVEGVDVVQVGSTARDTWLPDDRDVDLFVRFPPDTDREELERYGLDVGHAVLPEGREEYAEHPYVHGEYDGFAVDLVPCYAVADATGIQSAVDRTPFHTRYLADRIDADLAGAVRVTKGFLTAIGVYGSDLRTRGFSGYLTELLVVEYGGFRALVEAAADWHPTVELDPAGRHVDGTASGSGEGDAADAQFDGPLVVVDPTDPGRNVAAVCSAESVARFQHYARELLADPRLSLFEPDDPDPLGPAAVREAFADRGTAPVALRFDAPDLVEDNLYPQLEKSRASLRDALDRRGFDVLRSAVMADGTAVLLFECEVVERPTVERHEGPPVGVRNHADGFYENYEDDDAVYGPFVDGNRYVVERPREFTTAAGFLDSDAVRDLALGADVADAVAGAEVLVGETVTTLADEFGTEFAAYIDPTP
ncbi:CCA tRNA nucleotidyltransferase [Halobacteriales archaeon SW_7_68_16]|nr:MAG: CCA tRNA nucleotidyltransferase [Halobacteriales archaeon SW_7_68_16]